MIFTSSLISFGAWLATKIADKGFDYIFENFSNQESLNNKFYECVDRASRRLSNKYPMVMGGYVEYFFKHESIFSELVKLLFDNSKINLDVIRSRIDLETLPDGFMADFIGMLKEEMMKDGELSSILKNNEIFLLIQGLNSNLELIATTSTLSLLELRKIFEVIESRMTESFSLDGFVKTYKETALRVLSQVNFIGLGVDISIKRKGKILQDIFVKPLFAFYKKKGSEQSIVDTIEEPFDDQKQITYEELFNGRDRVVILGNPGSGKSVLIKSLMCDILNNRTLEFKDPMLASRLPFRIELRRYLVFKKSKGGNILKYLVTSLEEEFGIRDITEAILDGIFRTHNTILFFDGLDEIFKIKDKIEMKNDIENFHTVYPQTKSLTSSRIIGYDDASLSQDDFSELRILNFNERQIEEYVHKWYSKEESDEDIRAKEVQRFLEIKQEIDEELIRNPLLLSLIVIIYRNILKIPESKLEIYQSCTRTLVDKWDAEKELQIDLDGKIYKDKEKILSDLAYWQYEQLSGENIQLSYEKARGTVSKTLKNKLLIQEADECEELAEAFMNYAEKRSIYFDNNFTHKTFLEYYTAYWIYSNVEKKHKAEERDSLIAKYIDNPFWYIVLELLFNMIDKDQADSEIIDGIVSKQLAKSASSLPFILTILPTLKNISPQQVKEVFQFAIRYIIKNKRPRAVSPDDPISVVFHQIHRLYANSTYSRIIDGELIGLENTDGVKNNLIYGFYLELVVFGLDIDFDKKSFGLSDFSSYQSEVQKDPCLFRLDKHFGHKNLMEKYFDYTIDYVKNFGVAKLFKNQHAKFQSFYFDPYINFYLAYQTRAGNIGVMGRNLKVLEEMGVSRSMLLKHLEKGARFYIDNAQILVIANHFDNEVDSYISLILLYLLIDGVEHSFRKHFEESLTFDNLISICPNKNSILQEIAKSERQKFKVARELLGIV